MRKLSLTFCLVIVALFGSVGVGSARSDLPPCPSSGYKHNCFGALGTYGFQNGWKYVGEFRNDKEHGKGMLVHPDGLRYVGEWKEGYKDGQGIFIDERYGTTKEGIWKYNRFQYAQKTPYSKKTAKPSILRTAFKKLSKETRKQLQSNLKDLGFYKSLIDGLYGKGTAGALTAYNKQNLNGADLKKSENVEKLFNTVLGLKPAPKSNPNEKSKPKRDLEKEFELSFYGSFIHSEKVPNALFFFDNIEQNDSFEFRKSLRNHDIDLIVLSSPGGLVWEGLQIAGIINDKGLNVYVPKSSGKRDGNCASACSFMFFAGATRNVEGKLGVHQFLSKKNKKREEVGKTQKSSQFTVSEIIGFLNEFETPAWVFERMFQQSEMYYFKEKELVQLETEVSDELATHYEKSEKFISDFAKAFEEVAE